MDSHHLVYSLSSAVVVQSLSHIWLFGAPWTVACQASLSFTIFWICSNSCPLSQWYHPLSSSSPLAFNWKTSIRVFSKELVLPIRWPKYWSFSFSISPSNEYSGLIFFRIDWFDLFAVQGSLKSRLLQQQNLKYQFFGTQPLYGPTLISTHEPYP